MEIPLSSDKFTWSREGSVISRSLIDRFLMSNSWDEPFADTRVTMQVQILSDHFIIQLEVGSFEWRPPPFRLCTIKECCRVIENSLCIENQQGWAGFAISSKLIEE